MPRKKLADTLLEDLYSRSGDGKTITNEKVLIDGQVNIRNARQHFTQLTQYAGERNQGPVLMTNHRKPVAAVVGWRDLSLIQSLRSCKHPEDLLNIIRQHQDHFSERFVAQLAIILQARDAMNDLLAGTQVLAEMPIFDVIRWPDGSLGAMHFANDMFDGNLTITPPLGGQERKIYGECSLKDGAMHIPARIQLSSFDRAVQLDLLPTQAGKYTLMPTELPSEVALEKMILRVVGVAE